MPLDDVLLDAVAETIAKTERDFRVALNEMDERIVKAADNNSLFERLTADDIEELGNRLENAEQRLLGEVLDTLRDNRLELDEALFAARKRYDRLTAAFEERLAEIRDGDPGPPGESGQPGPEGVPGRSFRIRGTWLQTDDYQAMDIVALGGASFAARSDDPGPCPGEGWQLIASQGKRGNQGERGREGAKGDRGDPGLPVVAASVSDEGLLRITNGDGSIVTCDLYPLLAKVAR